MSGEELRAALDILDVIDGIVDDTHPEGHGCPLCVALTDLRAVLVAPSTPEQYRAAPSTEPALDVDALVVAMLEAVKAVALRHGIRPTEFLDAANAAANEVRRLAESQS